MDCMKCEYNNDGSGDCDTPYKEACLRAHHTDPITFVEEYSDIKLYPWQKIALKHFLKGDKNTNVRTESYYISRNIKAKEVENEI